MASSRPRRAAAKAVIIIDSTDDEDSKPESPTTKQTKRKPKKSAADTSFTLDFDEAAPKQKKLQKDEKATPKKRGRPPKASRVVGDDDETTKTKTAAKRPKKSDELKKVPAKRIKKDADVLFNSNKDENDGNFVSTTTGDQVARPPLNNNKKKPKYSHDQHRWTEPQLLAEIQHIDYELAQNVIQLFQDDNEIPFICRYRKELIGPDMTPDKLRDIKMSYNHVLNVKAKAETILRNLEKDSQLNDEIRSNILCAKSLDELDHLYAPYKPANKGSLFERARSIGLQAPADQIFHGLVAELPLLPLLNASVTGLESIEKVEDGIRHIIAHMISKDDKVLGELRQLQSVHNICMASKVMKSTATTATKSKKNDDEDKKPTTTGRPVDPLKFETYFDFRQPIKYVKPHQVLAMNRGESLKVLSVKIDIPDSLKRDLYHFVRNQFLATGVKSKQRLDMFDASFEEAYTKKLSPLMSRQIHAELTKTAQNASIEVFATNLKQLLLMSPVKGERIVGIDPGFTNGCKVAIISEQSEVLDTTVLYPHNTNKQRSLSFGHQLATLMKTYNCGLIALGNGTACRETEHWIGELFVLGILDRQRVRYSIVSEQGASIYSCGDIAKKEFPNMDVNLISAVSIARRLNDPLGEFVKVEPRHLGVGMYQHDVNEKLLTESLNEVVMECVSFVGVDINTASVALLRHIAGLTATRAENIVKHRTDNGPFRSRAELQKVKQIGAKTFVQCAGFVRIEPLTAGGGSGNTTTPLNRLDSTWVHPESYELAARIMRKVPMAPHEIGTIDGIARMSAFARSSDGQAAKLATEMRLPEERIQSVLDALQRELLRDYREDFDKKPMFKQGLTKMTDLAEGTNVSGAITNITHFGCFVDIGVERDGLIHVSKLCGMKPVIGDRVDAIVTQVDIGRGRIQLKLINIC